MIEKIIKTFFRKERKSEKDKKRRINSQIILKPAIATEEKTELHEFFKDFSGLRKVALLREKSFPREVCENSGNFSAFIDEFVVR